MAREATARGDERWLADVSAQVADRLRQRVASLRAAGHDPSELGPPDALVERMLAAVPEPSPWQAVGPFYSTRAVARLLGGVSRQAIEDRRRRRAILAVRTDDGTWLYPAFQFGADNRVLPGLAAVLAALADAGLSEWTVASMLVSAQPALDGRSIVEHLASGADDAVGTAVALCRATAAQAG